MHQLETPPRSPDRTEMVESHDDRSDEEILRSLTRHVPVTSDKNIWTFWDAGLPDMPAWCRQNVIDWVRVCGPDWTVRVLDNLPESPNYTLNYLERERLARAFVGSTTDGLSVGQPSAPLVRAAALSQHGGVWMDVGSTLSRQSDRVCQDGDSGSHQAAAVGQPSQDTTTYPVSCQEGKPLIRRWHQVLWAADLFGISDHPVVSFIKQMPREELEGSEDGAGFDAKVAMMEVLEHAVQIVAWARLATLNAEADTANGSHAKTTG